MEASDLRIGNWVYFEDEKLHMTTFGRIESIIKEEKYIRIKGIDQLGDEFDESLIDIEPIPLTPEILLACGFEEVKYETDDFHDIEYHLKVNEDIFISYSSDFSCGVWSNKSRMEEFGVLPKWESAKHLHGLQNLVHILSGQELEFETETK